MATTNKRHVKNKYVCLGDNVCPQNVIRDVWSEKEREREKQTPFEVFYGGWIIIVQRQREIELIYVEISNIVGGKEAVVFLF